MYIHVSLYTCKYIVKLYTLPTGGVWVNALREFGIIGSGPILDNCIANATHLVECSSSFSSFGCDHPEDVGVRCQGKYQQTCVVY